MKKMKIEFILPAIHFIYSFVFFILLEVYITVQGTNSEGYIPLFLLIPYAALAYLDFPISYLVESHLHLERFYLDLFYIISGTLLWFSIGVFLKCLIHGFEMKFRRDRK